MSTPPMSPEKLRISPLKLANLAIMREREITGAYVLP
jgi:hypothetical protein